MSDINKSGSVDEQEIAKFEAMADEWWDETGKFKPLHKFNPIRIGYIRDAVKTHFDIGNSDKPLTGLSILDIGCGGGLLCEPMKRLGADVTGIDASEKNIGIASTHAGKMGLDIQYEAITAEELVAKGKQYDVVLCMEVIEHVADVDGFLKSCAKLVKPGGMMVVATLNRTPKSYLFAIVGAEYVLRWLPKGTHEWKKFLKPSEVFECVKHAGVSLDEVKGASYNPLRAEWFLSSDLSVNYLMRFSKA